MQNNQIERPLRILTWNLERKKPSASRGAAAVAYIVTERPDIAVLTEARVGHLGAGGHEIVSQWAAAPGHASDERKVVMWSKKPWRDVDDVGHPGMPVGRFVAATTETALGPVRVMGICIPWHMCDVTYGSKDCKPWEQHLRWLACFAELVATWDHRSRESRVVHASSGNLMAA